MKGRSDTFALGQPQDWSVFVISGRVCFKPFGWRRGAVRSSLGGGKPQKQENPHVSARTLFCMAAPGVESKNKSLFSIQLSCDQVSSTSLTILSLFSVLHFLVSPATTHQFAPVRSWRICALRPLSPQGLDSGPPLHRFKWGYSRLISLFQRVSTPYLLRSFTV